MYATVVVMRPGERCSHRNPGEQTWHPPKVVKVRHVISAAAPRPVQTSLWGRRVLDALQVQVPYIQSRWLLELPPAAVLMAAGSRHTLESMIVEAMEKARSQEQSLLFQVWIWMTWATVISTLIIMVRYPQFRPEVPFLHDIGSGSPDFGGVPAACEARSARRRRHLRL